MAMESVDGGRKYGGANAPPYTTLGHAWGLAGFVSAKPGVKAISTSWDTWCLVSALCYSDKTDSRHWEQTLAIGSTCYRRRKHGCSEIGWYVLWPASASKRSRNWKKIAYKLQCLLAVLPAVFVEQFCVYYVFVACMQVITSWLNSKLPPYPTLLKLFSQIACQLVWLFYCWVPDI